MKDEPFALIGVNVIHDSPAGLKKIVEKENLNWSSIAGKGAIVRRWNNPSTPSFYVIDAVGKIRHKWTGHPGEEAIDTALEELIQEMSHK